VDKYNDLRVKIAEISELTRQSKTKWERYPGLTCTYQTIESDPIYLSVSCCKPGCFIQTEGVKLDVPCEELFELCSEIVTQIRQDTVQITAMVESLDALVEKPNKSETQSLN